MEAFLASFASFSGKLIIILLAPVLSGPWTAPPQRGVSSLPPLPLVEFQRKTDLKAQLFSHLHYTETKWVLTEVKGHVQVTRLNPKSSLSPDIAGDENVHE